MEQLFMENSLQKEEEEEDSYVQYYFEDKDDINDIDVLFGDNRGKTKKEFTAVYFKERPRGKILF